MLMSVCLFIFQNLKSIVSIKKSMTLKAKHFDILFSEIDMINFRTRKVSVFYNKLGHVEEDEELHNDEYDKDYSDLAEDEDEDYAFPLDAIKEDEDHASLYENPHQPIREEYPSSGPTRGQDSDTGNRSLRPEGDNRFDSPSPQLQRSPHGDRRKLSLGVILRKLSTGMG